MAYICPPELSIRSMFSSVPVPFAFLHSFLGCFLVILALIFQSKRKVFRDLMGVYC